ncbi:MAG: hypothetical protein EHM72_11995 [Calditrichaeota bacterium]|nr:MAG: hypothetical protein EHM72_11995 [Calditrichota bacterium]
MAMMNRRSFLQALSMTGAVSLLSCRKDESFLPKAMQPTGDLLYDLFRNPDASARPFFRWWWNDNRVRIAEIRRELELMAQAGAGGVEINPIALPAELYQNLTPEPLPWLSREWNRALLATAEEGKSYKMKTDLLIGTGWPFGGRFLKPEETIQRVQATVEHLSGPLSLEKTLALATQEPPQNLLQVKLFPATIKNIDEGINLTYHVEEGNILRADIPRGEWDLYIVFQQSGFCNVLYGAAGAEGAALDHFNAQAVTHYLRRISTVLNPLFGGAMSNGIRAMFCDSIELQGANWTTDLSSEFKARSGYEIEPYLPLLLAESVQAEAELVDILCRVRYDYSRTLAELFMERFVLVFHDWCIDNGVACRYQAYGHPWLYTDLLDGYLVPEIPEGDQWLYNSGWVKGAAVDDIRYSIWNKYASSAGHLADRKIISSEAMTDTSGLFETTLEYIKQATDLNLIGGINHLVLHGFNYSPSNIDFPGWIRFGTYFSEHNTWWPFLRLWMDYAARLCQIFQESRNCANVAIMGPTADVWRQFGLERNAWNLTPTYLHELWQALNHHGYCSDYINSTILRHAEFSAGKLKYGLAEYELLICADIETLEPEIMSRILDWATAGGKILFINKTPCRSARLLNSAEQDLQVQEMCSRVLQQFPQKVRRVVYDSRRDLTAWIGEKMKAMGVRPEVTISHPHSRLFVTHHVREERDIYFFCNAHRQETLDFQADFPIKDKTVWRWDAETGEKTPFALAGAMPPLSISPLESLLLVFESEAGDQTLPQQKSIDEAAAITLTGAWEVNLVHVDGAASSRTRFELIDFSQDEQLNTFSGQAIYSTTFRVKERGEMLLDLGQVFDIAQVSLNDHPLGVRWWGKKPLRIPSAFLKKKNQLTITVTTTLFNYMQTLQDRAEVSYWLERRKRTGLVSAGLVGPVRLIPIRS